MVDAGMERSTFSPCSGVREMIISPTMPVMHMAPAMETLSRIRVMRRAMLKKPTLA